jgi:competence protein ComEA
MLHERLAETFQASRLPTLSNIQNTTTAVILQTKTRKTVSSAPPEETANSPVQVGRKGVCTAWRRAAIPFALAALSVAVPSSAKAAELPDGPGKAVTVRLCGKCHSAEKAATLRQDEDGWTDTIAKMVKMGAQGSDDEFAAVLAYLTTNFGPEVAPPVNVNKADSVELESSLVLTRTEAAALIQYRTQKGPFKSIDDLRNIAGLDFKKIETQKSRITF